MAMTRSDKLECQNKEGNVMYMYYDNKGKIRLPNPNLGLYVVQKYLIEIAVAPVNQAPL